MAIVDKTHSLTIEEAFKSVAEGGSGGGCGYHVVTNETDYAKSQTVTITENSEVLFPFAEFIPEFPIGFVADGSSVRVEFDNDTYMGTLNNNVEKIVFPENQIAIPLSMPVIGFPGVPVEVGSTHTLRITIVSETVEVEDDFKKAVDTVAKPTVTTLYAVTDRNIQINAGIDNYLTISSFVDENDEPCDVPDHDIAVLGGVFAPANTQLWGFNINDYGNGSDTSLFVQLSASESVFVDSGKKLGLVTFIKFGAVESEPEPEPEPWSPIHVTLSNKQIVASNTKTYSWTWDAPEGVTISSLIEYLNSQYGEESWPDNLFTIRKTDSEEWTTTTHAEYVDSNTIRFGLDSADEWTINANVVTCSSVIN